MNYGRYQIVSELGRGSMGVVYEAHDPQINRRIALKVLREDRVTSDDYVQRFLKEATAIGRLSHPGIVTVYDVGQDHGTIYIAMEFLEGEPLDKLAAGRNLQLNDIVNIGTQVAQALHYAHEKGIVHRDIKPPNIICTAEKAIKVTDFGIAHIDDPDGQQMTRAGEILGTPVYMAPEQVMSQPVDGRTDLYSLGVILYELTTGQRPFQGENLAAIFRAITQGNPPSPKHINPNIPAVLSDVIMKTMARKPEERFATGRELAQVLKDSLTERPSTQYDATIIRSDPGKKPFPWVFMLVLLVLVIGGAGGYFYLQPGAKVEKQKESLFGEDVVKSRTEADTSLKSTEEVIPPQETVSTLPEQADRNVPLEDQVSVKPSARKVKKEATSSAAVEENERETTPFLENRDKSIEDIFTDDKPDTASEADMPASKVLWKEDVEKSEPPLDEMKDVQDVPVEAGKSEKTKMATLLPRESKEKEQILEKFATLQMNSRPQGARLYLDGNYEGKTPVELDVAATKHEVKLELDGHLDWKAQLDFSKGGNVPLSIRLLPE